MKKTLLSLALLLNVFSLSAGWKSFSCSDMEGSIKLNFKTSSHRPHGTIDDFGLPGVIDDCKHNSKELNCYVYWDSLPGEGAQVSRILFSKEIHNGSKSIKALLTEPDYFASKEVLLTCEETTEQE